VPVKTVAMTPTAATVMVAQAVQLTATPQDSTGAPLTGRAVTWVSSNAGVATVDGSGLVRGMAAGPTTITATSEGMSGTTAITTVNAPVASVTVSPAAPSMQVGQAMQLSATPKDVGGTALTGRVVTWASSNTGVATVNSSGLVTGVAAGSATITATSEGGSGTSALTVTNVPVASVTVSPAAPSVQVGQTVQLAATPKDAGGAALTGRVVTWASNNTGVATVNGTGLVTGVAAGSATITATSEGTNGTAALTVSVVPVASVTVTPATASIQAGQTVQLSATPKDAGGAALTGRVVTWASSATGVATVSGSGLVTGGAAGSATITATSEGQSGTAGVTVSIVPVASVTVTPATASISTGQTVQLTGTPKDASGTALTGRVVTWATSNAGVATVSGSGLVTGVAAGSATITATSEGKNGTAALTVTAVVTNPGTVADLAVAGVTDSSVTLSFTEVTDGTGQPASYDIRWAVGAIAWSSAADVTRGSCTVPVVGSTIGAKRSCTVLGLASVTGYQFQLIAFRGTLNVNAVFGGLSNVVSGTTTGTPVPVASVTVSPAPASVPVGQTVQLTATPRDANNNPLLGRVVTWVSSNTLVATVNGSGLVIGVATGSATITATSEGVTGTAVITVTVTAPPPPPPGGTLLQEGFDNANLAARGWYDGNPATISATEYHTGGGSLEARFLAGATNPSWGTFRHLFTPSPTLYVSFWVKYSTNWIGSGKLYHPHEFMILSDLDGDWDGLSNDYLTAYIEQVYQNGGVPHLALQDNKSINLGYGTPPTNLVGVTENRSVSGCNGIAEFAGVDAWSCFNGPPWYNNKEFHAAAVAFQPNPGPGYKSDWNHVEAYFQMNSVVGGIGQTDGIVRYWFNGALVIERTNVLFRTGAHPALQFKQIVIAPYIGDGSPVDQTVWYDDLTVATSKP
ncbi:MAG: hypothetical protein E6H01_06260, partial [Bacillati bacterium ANGP1]